MFLNSCDKMIYKIYNKYKKWSAEYKIYKNYDTVKIH